MVLAYDGMGVKRSIMNTATTGSFDWIWKTGFETWLKGDAPIFWITGKPGSGKSTLIKYLTDAAKTRDILRLRGGQCELLHFFFDFRYGSGVANSPEGMLRSLLLQLSNKDDDIAERLRGVLDPKRLNGFTTPELQDVISDVLRRTPKMCAFIDGLDEYRGDMIELLSILFDLRERTDIRLCLASRANASIKTKLKDHPYLVMQEHNLASIKRHLYSLNDQAAARLKAPCPQEIVDEIVIRAEGVILWARFAFESLLEICATDASVDTLRVRLGALPPQMEGMYRDSLARIPSTLILEAALCLFFVDISKGGVTLTELQALLQTARRRMPDKIQTPPHLTENQFEHRISTLLGGLLVPLNVSQRDFWDRRYLSMGLDIYFNDDDVRLGTGLEVNDPHKGVVRPVHETMHAYLKQSKWCEAHLESNLKVGAFGQDSPLERLFGSEVTTVTLVEYGRMTLIKDVFFNPKPENGAYGAMLARDIAGRYRKSSLSENEESQPQLGDQTPVDNAEVKCWSAEARFRYDGELMLQAMKEGESRRPDIEFLAKLDPVLILEEIVERGSLCYGYQKIYTLSDT